MNVFVEIDDDICVGVGKCEDLEPNAVELGDDGLSRPLPGVALPQERAEAICKNCERLKLWGEIGHEPEYLVELTAFGTTLAMNYLTRGTFTGDRKKVEGKKLKVERKSTL